MAIYSLSAMTISRASGKSAVAAAAYRSGEALDDDRQGLRHDYRAKGGVLHSEIVTPKVVPIWAHDRNQLWNHVESAEDKSTRRDTAKTARDWRVALPHELNAEQRLEVVRELSQYLVDTYGAVVDFAIHAPGREGDMRNFHAHLLMSTRVLGADGFGAKIRSLDSPITSGKELLAIREKWESIANAALEKAGFDVRIDHRSNVKQGRDMEPGIHFGPHASAMERNGEVTELGNLNRDIAARNAERAKLEAERDQLTCQIIDLEAARDRKAGDKAEKAEAKTLDPARILAAITERRATFTRGDLNYALRDVLPNVKERSAFMDMTLAQAEVVPLRENASAPVSRYTTRDVLASERQVMDASRRMTGRASHGLSAHVMADTLDHHSHLDGEQRKALDHATKAGGFAILAGEAGTGKSTTLAAIRDAYESAGYRVQGLAWTNSVVQDMKADGFANASTIAGELMRHANGRGSWDNSTVLMVDEAAMISTKHLSALMTEASAAGAKVILAGDDKQLASIERGGMFSALRGEHGAAELHSVRRVSDLDQREAFNAMHKGDFRAALGRFDKRGAIHWAKEPDDARAALVQKWADDTAADPRKARFVFAYTNAEVADLNRDLRAIRKERGELGEDTILPTRYGEAAFAVGDRVQITASASDRKRRDAGLFNGAAGTLQEIDGNRITLNLDTPKGAEPRLITLTVGSNAAAGEFDAIRHGYAGTIYKGQGKTLDRSYVLHSDQWRAASGYVALTRHREEMALFASERGAAWMHADGGISGLTDKQLASAEKSYSAWAEAKPELAAKYGIADYVSYVQGEALATKDADRLDRMARQMGRVEEVRAASQFVPGRAVDPTEPPPANAPRIMGRYDELRALGEAVEARKAGARPNQQVQSEKAASGPQKPAEQPTSGKDKFADLLRRAGDEASKKADDDKPQDIRDFVRERSRERGRGPTR